MSEQTPPPADDQLPAAPAAPVAPAVPAQPANGMGTAALILGIVNFLCLPYIGSILAIIFGRIGMKNAREGRATNGGMAKAGFILGIVGLVLSVVGTIIFIVAIGIGVKVVSENLDPKLNSETHLADGNYGMNPNTSIRLNERCSFGGIPINAVTAEEGTSSVTVVGDGVVQCGFGSGTPDVVLFTVTDGVAEIVAVE